MAGGKVLPREYFERPPFAGALPGELFHRYSCQACGNRSRTWNAFRLHRAVCLGYQRPAAEIDVHHEEQAAS